MKKALFLVAFLLGTLFAVHAQDVDVNKISNTYKKALYTYNKDNEIEIRYKERIYARRVYKYIEMENDNWKTMRFTITKPMAIPPTKADYYAYILTNNSSRINAHMRGDNMWCQEDSWKIINSLMAQGLSHGAIISKLRELNENLAATYNALETVFERSNPFPYQLVVYRFAGADDPISLSEIGEIIPYEQFISVSLDRDINCFNDRPIEIKIIVPKGTKIFITENYFETEAILYKPAFQIKKIQKKAGKTIYTVEVVNN